jgi:hypothetical protein
MVLYSIDRFEGKFAVCENLSSNEFCNIPKKDLPKGCKEGSIIKYDNNHYYLDNESTKNNQNQVKNLVNNLFKRD